MFGFIKKMFIVLLTFRTLVSFSGLLISSSQEPIQSVSLKHRPCQTGPTLAD